MYAVIKALVGPEVAKALRRKLSVPHSMLDVLMPEISGATHPTMAARACTRAVVHVAKNYVGPKIGMLTVCYKVRR